MMIITIFSSLLFIASLTFAQSNNGIGISPFGRGIVNATQAEAAIAGAVASANSVSIPFCIAVLDPFGLLVAFLRQDSAYPGSIDIAIKKAKTVVLFNGTPSGFWYNASRPGPSDYVYGIENSNDGLIVFGGGVPLVVDGVLIGSIGVSGGSAAQDVVVAEAGARAIGAGA